MSEASSNIRELLYSFPDLIREVKEERSASVLNREKLDTLEIEKIFRSKRRERARQPQPRTGSEDRSLLSLLRDVVPDIPEENHALIAKIAESGQVAKLEEAVAKELLSKEQACSLWANRLGVAYVDPLQSIATEEAIAAVPEEIARRLGVLGVYVMEGVITVVSHDPGNPDTKRRLAGITGLEVSLVFALPSEIRDAINVAYARNDTVKDTISRFEAEHGAIHKTLSDLDIAELGDAAPIIKIVDALVHLAVQERASDIHIEPMEARSRVRFRIDGRLHEKFTISKKIHVAVIARLKILSRLNIDETRFPQDGKFSLPWGTGKADFRSSFIPTINGNKAVIRILASAAAKSLMTLDEMLISGKILKPFRRVIHNPNGIIFITGPTGSGKTTTLYAALQELNSEDVNISTIEDPVEIQMQGLTQSQVNKHIDLDFPLLLRSLLRQDPDIILVGEIRDKETAKIATEAALTGHLVFATLHTNNAIQAVIRLVEIGIEPYMVAPSINCVLAQRLCGRLDERFKEAYTPDNEVLDRFFRDYEGEEPTFYRPSAGLPPGKGYHGRVAIHELAIVSDEIRSLISSSAGTRELTIAARKLGYQPLRYDGLKKVLLGLTTIEEVERATPVEWLE